MSKLILLFFIFYILSRIYFINAIGVFFDSNEYLNLFNLQNYASAIVSGHIPPHVGYIVLFWPVFQCAKLLSIDPGVSVVFGQIVCSSFILIYYYKIILFISDKVHARQSVLLVSVLPLFWLTTTTIMMDNTGVFFFLLSLYLFTKYLSHQSKTIFLHASALFFSIGFVTEMLLILWAPLFLILFLIKNNWRSVWQLGIYVLYSVLISVVIVFGIMLNSHEPLNQVVQLLYFSKSNELSVVQFNTHGFLIILRNFFIPEMYNNTSIVVMFGLIALIYSIFKKKLYFTLGLLWILPAAYTNLWWDSLLMGRHALLASFGFAFLVPIIFKRNIHLFGVLIFYIIVITLPSLLLIKQDIPYITNANALQELPKNSIIIDTHFARPQSVHYLKKEIISVNEPIWPVPKIAQNIDNALHTNKPVFITSGALSEPYGLYSGPYLHPLTLSYRNDFVLQNTLSQYTLSIYKIISQKDNMLIYSIDDKKSHPYPTVMKMTNLYRNAANYDPFLKFILRFFY